MNYIRLTYFTISDLLFSGIFIIMSIIYSGFPKELSAIFIISFMFRFVWNYFILKEHKIELNSQQKEDKKEGKPHTSPVSVVIEGDTSSADTLSKEEEKE